MAFDDVYHRKYLKIYKPHLGSIYLHHSCKNDNHDYSDDIYVNHMHDIIEICSLDDIDNSHICPLNTENRLNTGNEDNLDTRDMVGLGTTDGNSLDVDGCGITDDDSSNVNEFCIKDENNLNIEDVNSSDPEDENNLNIEDVNSSDTEDDNSFDTDREDDLDIGDDFGIESEDNCDIKISNNLNIKKEHILNIKDEDRSKNKVTNHEVNIEDDEYNIGNKKYDDGHQYDYLNTKDVFSVIDLDDNIINKWNTPDRTCVLITNNIDNSNDTMNSDIDYFDVVPSDDSKSSSIWDD